MNYLLKAISIVLAGLCLSVMSYAQNITMQVKNVTVKEAMSQLEKKTNYSFIFSSSDTDTKRIVSFSVKNSTIDEAVKQILTGQDNITYSIQGNKIILKNVVKTVRDNKLQSFSGRVLDANKQPVIGAAIKQAGTNNGVITDVDGNFSITVPANSVLEVSCIGFITKTISAQTENMNLTMQEDTELLDEVVVIGYGTMKKKDLMGANSVLSGNDLTTSSSVSVGGALQGKMSGMSILSSSGFPGSETSINIRGVGTFGSGDTSPLIVIDGIPVDGGFETLNPSDIESVNVMKDASSAAIYGSRAANGVVLITTKKGKTGKSQLSVNLSYGIQTPSHLMDLLNATEFVSVIQEMRDNYNKIYKPAAGKEATTKYDGLDPKSFGKGTNWNDYMYDSAPTLNVNASASGGTDQIRYYISGEYMNQEGIAINTSYKKASLRANVEGQVTNRLKVGNNMHLAYRNSEGSSGYRYSDVVFNAPITPAYDDDGTYGEPNSSLTGSKNALAEVG